MIGVDFLREIHENLEISEIILHLRSILSVVSHNDRVGTREEVMATFFQVFGLCLLNNYLFFG